MLIESSCIPKYRDLSQPGDDVLAIVPQRLYAVFDGATDTVGLSINGESPGRFAARQAAMAMVSTALAPDHAARAQARWLIDMNRAIAEGLLAQAPPGTRAGTTAAAVLDCGDELRFLIVGDSGVRINGTELIHLHKDVDRIYTAGRIAAFKRLQTKGWVGDALEQGARQLVAKGLSQAAQFGLDAHEVESILRGARQACVPLLQPDAVSLVESMLLAGIAQGQYGFANRAGHSLGYAVVDGGDTQGADLLAFSRPKSEVRSIELFTDGYATCPPDVTLRAWEDEFARVEALDYAKTAAYPGVKGSTTTQFSDDRSVLVAHFQSP
ncbi:hypothetical protein [Polaromonas sp.]|uniref:hypothetical protein n=1 Tax=Polaromonas sp. TaxID=1869339 RepID=UPI002FCBC9BF